jgi:CRISPR-associated endonuclease/helicase Cas3
VRVDRTVGSEALAHLTEDGRAHALQEHLEMVGNLAERFASAFDSGSVARLAGRWHDLGKYSATFQRMIREENGFEAHIEVETQAPRDHSTAGAVHALRQTGMDPDVAAALAFAIAGHHAGLADSNQLKHRLNERAELLDQAIAGGAATHIIDGAATKPVWLPAAKDAGARRRLELWTRMVFSALCDADFLDTEAFYDAMRPELRRNWPEIGELRTRLDQYMSSKEQAAERTPVNEIRAEIRRAAQVVAARPPGAYSLTVPTGGGKTLAAMTFALAHGETHGLRRVVVAIPYTSIIEQNADVYREALGHDAVLEHHSALDPDSETPKSRVASENWDAPVIVTTTVQLLESLLAARPSRCRKLHRLARSVIVLDEAQTLPPTLLLPIVEVLALLVRDYGATVVISTATQPVLGRSDIVSTGFEHVHEIVPAELRLFERLRRVSIRWPRSLEPVSYDSVADELARERDVLAIVHRRVDAHQLCELVDARVGEASTIHLSALMCPQHRAEILERIRSARARGESMRVVSTQVVEAGVDLDFPVVYRALAGADSISQAAGRCNREGRMASLGEVRVFIAPTNPPKGVLQTALGVTRGMLSRGPLSLDDPKVFRDFFSTLYRSVDRDAKAIQDDRELLRFRETARKAKLIENGWTESLVVPYGESPAIIAELSARGPSRMLLRKLQRFTVSIPRRLVDEWRSRSLVSDVAGIPVLASSSTAYDARFGLVYHQPSRLDARSPTIADSAEE